MKGPTDDGSQLMERSGALKTKVAESLLVLEQSAENGRLVTHRSWGGEE